VLVDLCLAFFLPTHAETEPEIDWDARLSQNNLVTGIFSPILAPSIFGWPETPNL